MKAEPNKYDNPYRVPENYFEEATSKILSLTVDRKEKKIPLNRYIFRPWHAVAAGIAALLLIGLLTKNISRTDDFSKALNGLSSEAYIEDVDLLTLEENVGSAGIYGTTSEVSDEGIIDYLLQDNIAVTEIYEQL